MYALAHPVTMLTESNKMLLCISIRCSHCRELEPVWQEVAKQLDGVVHVGKVQSHHLLPNKVGLAFRCFSSSLTLRMSHVLQHAWLNAGGRDEGKDSDKAICH